MGLYAGVDACKKGKWVIAVIDDALVPGELSGVVRGDFGAVLDATASHDVVVVDMPIGLSATSQPGGRDADVAARRILGSALKSSVFPAPARPVIAAKTYDEANRLAKTYSVEEKGLSPPAWGIVPRIRDVDEHMTPDTQRRVVEGHPELSFTALNGNDPLEHGKSSAAGILLRMRLLDGAGLLRVVEKSATRAGKCASLDDVLDAVALAWTARRKAHGEARRIPEHAPADARGLRMEMWY